MKLIIITGVNKGLGLALYNRLCLSDEVRLFAISRNFNENQRASNSISLHKVDLSKSQVIEDIFKNVRFESFSEIVFISNAATINPIDKIGNFSANEINSQFQLNTISPINIVNYLIHNTVDNQLFKVLSISSGAAKQAIVGWSLYCSTKASLEMFFNTLDKETEDNVIVKNIDPGVMDTDMQKQIRSTSESKFPNVNSFVNYKTNNVLKSAEDVADIIIMEQNLLR